MVRKNKIQKLIKPGDYIYSTNGGEPLKVTEVTPIGINTEEDFYEFEEHRILYFLTEAGYRQSLIKGDNR